MEKVVIELSKEDGEQTLVDTYRDVFNLHQTEFSARVSFSESGDKYFIIFTRVEEKK